jgi:hypothetical protein
MVQFDAKLRQKPSLSRIFSKRRGEEEKAYETAL